MEIYFNSISAKYIFIVFFHIFKKIKHFEN